MRRPLLPLGLAVLAFVALQSATDPGNATADITAAEAAGQALAARELMRPEDVADLARLSHPLAGALHVEHSGYDQRGRRMRPKRYHTPHADLTTR